MRDVFFSPPRALTAIKQFVCLAFIGIPLRTIIGRPQDVACALAQDPCRLIPHLWYGSLRCLAMLSGETLNAFDPGHLMVGKAKHQRDAARGFRVIAIEFRREFRMAFAP